MNILVTSAGSAGDFLPPLAIAAVLRRRGHRIQFVANPYYEKQVLKAGLEFIPAGPFGDIFAEVEKNPVLVDPLKGGLILLDEFAIPNAEAIYPVLQGLIRAERPDAIVGNNVCFSAYWVASQHHIPSALVNPTPLAWATYSAPTFISENPLPGFLQGPATGLVRVLMERFVSGRLRKLARRLGSTVADASIVATEASVASQIAVWSPRVRGPAKSDPPNGTICGFVRASALGGTTHGVPAEVESFLQSGTPPVVVGLGSIYSLAAGEVLSNIAAACADIGRRCLIVGHPSNAKYPANTLAVRYAPYEAVFPRAAVVAVHGGAGSTGEAFRSGRPILGIPFAYDQFFNAAQVERLGVGACLRTKERTRSGFGGAFKRLLEDVSLQNRAAESGRKFSVERDGAEVGAGIIERIAGMR